MNAISMAALGRRGRWGNQMFQFAFLRAYALAKGLTLHIPDDWLGRKLFNCPEPSTAGISAKRIDLDEILVLGQWDQWIDRLAGYDLCTYAQHQKYLDWYTRTQAKEWFALIPPWDEYEKALIVTLPQDYVACHLRRGDYARPPFNQHYAVISDESYDEALKEFNLPDSVVYVEEGWREPSQKVKDAGMPWLDDFLILKNATYLLRANSSFSYWSGVLSKANVYSPIVENMVGVHHAKFVEGNWPRTSGHVNQSDLHLKEC